MDALDFRTHTSRRPATSAVPAVDELWAVNGPKPRQKVQTADLRLLSCAPNNGRATLLPYAEYLSHLLNGRLHHLVLPEHDTVTAVQRAAHRSDLVILDEPEQSFMARFCLGRPGQKFASRLPTSVLVARQPLWPLRQLLLVLRLDGCDGTAVFWAKRLAQASGAAVTVLPLVPALPAMYASRPNGVASLLTSQTGAGQQVRQMARWLNDAQVTAVIRLRQGEPGEQIRSEVEASLYDLVLLGAEPEAWWPHWLLGNLVTPLLSWINHPVLIARPSPRSFPEVNGHE
jgi:nucleotide-binding universal stress UspA family protein